MSIARALAFVVRCRPEPTRSLLKFTGNRFARPYIAPRKAGLWPLLLMESFAAPKLNDLRDALASQVGAASRADVVLAMQTLQTHLRGRFGDGEVTLEHPSEPGLWCASAGFVDLMLALFAWSKTYFQYPRGRALPLVFRLASRGEQVEIGILEQAPTKPSVRRLTLWSQLGARVEQLGASMQVDAQVESCGQWRRLWIDGVDAPLRRSP